MDTLAQPSTGNPVPAVRRFNRFYTRQIGLLHEKLLHSQFSLTEVRVLYELAHRDHGTATELCKELLLDPGYLSRILRGFQARGLVGKTPSGNDARQAVLLITPKGQQAFAELDARSSGEIEAMLQRLSPVQQDQLVKAMSTIEQLLDGERQARSDPFILRPQQPGDMGWVVHRHGVLYAREYGYDEHFEALVAEIVAEFIANFDPKRERCWIAERDGEIVGSVFVVSKSATVAKLRLLLVEPGARGLGIGKRLVEECVRFARQVGYKKMVLWTQSELHAARSIYEKAGFRRANRKPHHSWGKDLVAEAWEMKL